MKCLIVDDHALIRDAMRGVLASLCPDADVLDADGATRALALAAAHPDLDLVLLDVDLPDGDGFDVLAALRASHPATAVVMLSALREPAAIRRALAAGAQGFVPKAETRDVLLGALGLVLAGGVYVPPLALVGGAPATGGGPPASRPASSARATVSAAVPSAKIPGSGPDAAGVRPTPAALGLTARQLDVLALVVQGCSNKLICRALDLAEPTVKNHVSAILRALGASSRTEAVVAVNRLGWDLSDRVGGDRR
jgi:DNA-binding NarL/FixJ family response regulator